LGNHGGYFAAAYSPLMQFQKPSKQLDMFWFAINCTRHDQDQNSTGEITGFPPLDASKFSQAGQQRNWSKKPVSLGTAGFSQDAKTTLISNKNCDEKIEAEKICNGAWSAADYHARHRGLQSPHQTAFEDGNAQAVPG
jgi:hypothetical protein